MSPEERREHEHENTPVLQEIVELLFTELDEQSSALNRLEHHFRDRLLLNVGDVSIVGAYAEQFRLRITEEERSTVLDYIAEQKMVVVTIDVVETAINDLLGWHRFTSREGRRAGLRRSFFLGESHFLPSTEICSGFKR